MLDVVGGGLFLKNSSARCQEMLLNMSLNQWVEQDNVGSSKSIFEWNEVNELKAQVQA